MAILKNDRYRFPNSFDEPLTSQQPSASIFLDIEYISNGVSYRGLNIVLDSSKVVDKVKYGIYQQGIITYVEVYSDSGWIDSNNRDITISRNYTQSVPSWWIYELGVKKGIRGVRTFNTTITTTISGTYTEYFYFINNNTRYNQFKISRVGSQTLIQYDTTNVYISAWQSTQYKTIDIGGEYQYISPLICDLILDNSSEETSYGFSIELLQSSCEKNRINKINYLSDVASVRGVLRDNSSIVNPSILIELNFGSSATPTFNYAYIPFFNRYYFITDITSVENGLWLVTMKCDVLMTYKDGILTLNGMISRQENDYNPYLIDKQVPISNDPEYSVIDYGNVVFNKEPEELHNYVMCAIRN